MILVNKNKSGTGKTIAIMVIGGVILLIIGTQVTDFFNSPNLIGSVKGGTTSLCPTELNFFRGTSAFTLTFVNLGDEDGDFSTKIMSNDILSKYKGSGDDFSQSSSQNWYAQVDTPQNFNFELQRIDDENPPETIKIDVDASCGTDLMGIVALECGSKQFSCKYNQDEQEHRSTYYNLIS